MRDARVELQKEQRRLQQISSGLQPNAGGSAHRLGDDQPVQKAKIERLEKELARLQARHDDASARWNTASRLVTNIEAWLNENPGAVIKPYSGEPAKLKRSETAEAALSRIRALRAALQADKVRAQAAPLPRDEIKRRARLELDELANRAPISVNGRGEISWPRMNQRLELLAISQQPVQGFAAGETIDALAIVATLLQPALIAALDREVDRLDDTGALDDGARADRLADLAAQMLDLDRQECALLEADGDLPSSPVDVRAYLQIEGPAPRDHL